MMQSKKSTKNPFQNYFIRLFSISAVLVVVPVAGWNLVVAKPETNPDQQVKRLAHSIEQPKIQMAILLDTSGSMDGLIDQTRNQLWQVVNEFAGARRNGMTPRLEVALFEYGNDGNPAGEGYVRQLTGFTTELDDVSEGLFSLTTNGGSEYCGYAIKTAVDSLGWSQSDNDIKTIFIAGNEPFTQGPVNYQSAIKQAKAKGITVNTIHAGNHQQGVSQGWQSGAVLAGGDYMSIDANQKIVHIKAPQDQEIARLNNELNQTYLAYGKEGEIKMARQQEQDSIVDKISGALLSQRAASKASSYYRNDSWDLVDAIETGRLKEEEVAAMAPESLPEPMRTMSDDQKKDFVQKKVQKRAEIKAKIAKLSKQRESYVVEERKQLAVNEPSVGQALSEAVKKQAEQKNFELQK